MANFYNDAVDVLLANGWKKINPASFTRGDLEVFFDTSHHVEINNRSTGKSIHYSPLVTREEFEQFLACIEAV